MARIHLTPDLDAMIEFDSVSLTMPRARRRGGHGTRQRLRRLAGEERKQQVLVLDDVSVSIAPGECLAVLGGEDDGCEEFLRLAAGTLIPDSGTVRRRSEVVPILDDSRCLDATYTTRQNIYVVGSLLGMSPQQVGAKLKWIVEMTGAGKWLDAYLRSAPKNLRQRLVWAVTMATEARAFAIEEALVVGKDEVAERCWAYVEQCKAEGVTFVLSASDPAMLTRFCDRAIVLKDGRIIADTTVSEALSLVPLHPHRHVEREERADDDEESDPVV